MDKYQSLLSMHDTWLADRPIMEENNTTERLLKLLNGEVDEAMEVGLSQEELVAELADIGIFLFSIFRQLNVDLYDAVSEKMAFNLLRYNHLLFKDGDYGEARKKVKANEGNIKRDFYE